MGSKLFERKRRGVPDWVRHSGLHLLGEPETSVAPGDPASAMCVDESMDPDDLAEISSDMLEAIDDDLCPDEECLDDESSSDPFSIVGAAMLSADDLAATMSLDRSPAPPGIPEEWLEIDVDVDSRRQASSAR